MAIPSLLGSYIDQTYQRLVQTTGSGAEFADGLGNPISFGTTTPGGSNTQIQFNSASKFAADSSFVFDYTKKALLLGTGHSNTGFFSLAVGKDAIIASTGSACIGIDTGTSLYAHYSLVNGESTYASAYSSHAEGQFSTTYGAYSHAEGRFGLAIGIYSHAEGDTCFSRGESSHAEGYNTISSGSYSHSEGSTTLAFGISSHAEGNTTISSGSYSHAEGEFTLASGQSSHAEGQYVSASGDYSHAEGYSTIASGSYSHAEGYFTVASGQQSHAEGDYAIASGSTSHAEGAATLAIGESSHAEGRYTTSSGDYSHAEGEYTLASGRSSHAEGYFTMASGNNSHAEGEYTTAYGNISHAEGSFTRTGQLGWLTDTITPISAGVITINPSYGDIKPYIDGNYIILDDRAYDDNYSIQLFEISSTSAGIPTIINLVDTTVSTTTAVIGVPNVAAPTNADIPLPGRSAHSEGNTTLATGNNSHAAGDQTNAIGYASYAGGLSTISYRPSQTVVGRYNAIKRPNSNHYDYSFVVGKGTSATLRDNIFEVLSTQDTINLSASQVYANGLSASNTQSNVVSIDTADSGRLYTTAVSSIRPKAGSIPSSSFSGTVKTCSVSLNTPFPDNNYAVTVTGTDGFAWSIISKTSGSFGLSSNSTSAITGPVYWIATPFNNS